MQLANYYYADMEDYLVIRFRVDPMSNLKGLQIVSILLERFP
jgi:hypothetical protein